MQKIKQCPKCGYEGSMECISALGDIGEKCICPECNYQFGNLETMDY